MNREQKKQWMIEQLAPYLADPSTCGYENGSCKYKTSDGRMCVAGKNMKEEFLYYNNTIRNLLMDHPPHKVFNNNFAVGASKAEWGLLQDIHDLIARGERDAAKDAVSELGYFTWEELQEAADDIRNKTNYEQ